MLSKTLKVSIVVGLLLALSIAGAIFSYSKQNIQQNNSQPVDIASLGAVHLTTISDSKIAGYVTAEGKTVVDFTVEKSEDKRAEATFHVLNASQEELKSLIVGPNVGGISFQGVTVDGYGVRTQEELNILQSLANSIYGDILPIVSLELGCLLETDTYAYQQAAVVLPWQLLMKYVSDYPSSNHFATQAQCTYVGNHKYNNEPRSLIFGSDEPIPFVRGILPLDAQGEVKR